MPSFEGLEDPKQIENYQQIELADGGVVEREGFSEGDQPFDGRKEYNKQYYLDNKERIRELEKQSRGKKKNVQISDELPSRLRGNKTINGRMMFLNQAKYAFNIWTNIVPEIDDEVIKLLD